MVYRSPPPFEQEATPVAFTLGELWLLQGCVRHEIASQDTWRRPPADLALNTAIADAIYDCVEFNLGEVTLLLSAHHTLIIDALVPQAAKDADGHALGKVILLKSFAARRALAGDSAPAVEPELPDVAAKMAEYYAHLCVNCGQLKAAPQKEGSHAQSGY